MKYNKFGNEVKNYLKEMNMSVLQLAKLAGYDQGNLSKILNGELSISIEKLNTIVDKMISKKEEIDKKENKFNEKSLNLYKSKLLAYGYIDKRAIPEEFYMDEEKIDLLTMLFIIFFNEDINFNKIIDVVKKIYEKTEEKTIGFEFLEKDNNDNNSDYIDRLYSHLNEIKNIKSGGKNE